MTISECGLTRPSQIKDQLFSWPISNPITNVVDDCAVSLVRYSSDAAAFVYANQKRFPLMRLGWMA
jgi:hypothetical protein